MKFKFLVLGAFLYDLTIQEASFIHASVVLQQPGSMSLFSLAERPNFHSL